MFKDKTLRETLFGKGSDIGDASSRVSIVTFPANGIEGERTIKYPTGDGFALYLIRRIEEVEARLIELEAKKK